MQCFVASLPVRLLFKYVLNNALSPVSSAQFNCRIAAMKKPDKMHCVVDIQTIGEQVRTRLNLAHWGS